jgi:uncharacterized protein
LSIHPKIISIFLFILFLAGAAYSQPGKSLYNNPTQLSKYVVDETGTLTQDQINTLLRKLVDFDKTTSNQVIVYMIPSLNGETIEDVSIKLAEKNLIGQKGKDNGVLFLIAKDDRKMRIEVGYGLEGALPDATAATIIRNEVTPEFKNGKYYEGITKGVDAIIAATKGEYKADEDSSNNPGAGGCCFGLPVFIVIIFVFIFASIFISVIKRIFGIGRSVYSGGRRSGWFWGGGGFGGGSGWSSGSGSSFGGFSGGGGSFGGGGASGSW